MNETRELTHLDLFSGIGGFALAAGWAGFTTVGFCEIEPFCREVLMARFGAIADTGRESIRPALFSDIRTLDGSRFRNVSLLTGGFPCQPFSVAGKRRGKEDDRFLWPEMFRVISEARPAWVIGENVAGFVNMALDEACADLEGEGYEVQPIVIPACAVNAPHRRDRVWIVGRLNRDAECQRGQGRQIYSRDESATCPNWPADSRLPTYKDSASPTEGSDCDAPDAERDDIRAGLCQGGTAGEWRGRPADLWGTPWIEVATSLCRVDDGLPPWVHARRTARLKALGNSIVPQVAYEILKTIAEIERGKV